MTKRVAEFKALGVTIVTCGRSPERPDSTGDYLHQALNDAGHEVIARHRVPHNRHQIRAVVSACIVEPRVDVVVLNGGTGFAQDNQTVQAITPLFDRMISGFGEIFRQLSFAEIGGASIQSEATAGLANGTLIVALPGAQQAAALAWERILKNQLDGRTGPCNFIPHLVSSLGPCRKSELTK
ncbi:MogA/MoaB family molybdenum cofactor biosynthesis protein [Aliidiomarina sanyensis]|uniref:Molybdenum cofactor biosynthesis protein B n=1 Tax=Aliidiomarina sanyensis TaxID=1249555 RepID=A0A432WRH3_9GAMM|nr:molybdenum cofactor biosynthesis protein B [Aliidiomarina sanyensis]RUO36370.1 molybdenum cofactor biosynthesis protein [Aliidiomarina sanyensis]